MASQWPVQNEKPSPEVQSRHPSNGLALHTYPKVPLATGKGLPGHVSNTGKPREQASPSSRGFVEKINNPKKQKIGCLTPEQSGLLPLHDPLDPDKEEAGPRDQRRCVWQPSATARQPEDMPVLNGKTGGVSALQLMIFGKASESSCSAGLPLSQTHQHRAPPITMQNSWLAQPLSQRRVSICTTEVQQGFPKPFSYATHLSPLPTHDHTERLPLDSTPSLHHNPALTTKKRTFLILSGIGA